MNLSLSYAGVRPKDSAATTKVQVICRESFNVLSQFAVASALQFQVESCCVEYCAVLTIITLMHSRILFSPPRTSLEAQRETTELTSLNS
jgi:hypothetical protein